jgi:hypothetical protein
MASGCASKTAAPAPADVSPVETPFELPAENLVEPIIEGHSGSPTPWPEDAIPGAHGWLAIGSGAPEAGPPWYAIEASQPALILDPEWSVPSSSTLQAVVPGGRVPVVIQPRETAKYGCEGGYPVEDVTPLKGETPAGMLWVVSPTFSNAQGLELQTTDSPDSRTWQFGDQVMGLTRTDLWHADLWLGTADQVLESFSQDEQFIGDEDEPIDIEGGFVVPQIDAVWQVGSATVVGLYWFSREGVHFDAMRLDGAESARQELGYLYRCAG